MNILVINGPNLNMLGIREPELYGKYSYADLVKFCHEVADKLGIDIETFQSNHEGEIVEKIHESYEAVDGIVINPAAFSHTSVAILDALKTVSIPTVEVHITDPKKREEFRHQDFIALYAYECIAGQGFAGYEMAIKSLYNKLS